MSRDGRIGIAAETARASAAAVLAALGMLTIEAEKASDLSSTLERIGLALATVAALGPLADGCAAVASAIREAGRASSDPDTAAPVWRAAAAAIASHQIDSASLSVTRTAALSNAVTASLEAACLGEMAVAVSQGSFVDRQSAVAAKARLIDETAAPLERLARLAGEAVWSAAARAIDEAAGHLAARALDLRPVIRVTTTVRMSAVAAAWALYQDPQRATEIVARNRCGTPAMLPPTFEALAP